MADTPPVSEREQAAQESYAGFVVTCENCGSRVVSVQSNVGYSEESGSWGSVFLRCEDCHATATLYEP